MPGVRTVTRESLKLAQRGHQVADKALWTGDIRHPFRRRQAVPALSTIPDGCSEHEKYLRLENRL